MMNSWLSFFCAQKALLAFPSWYTCLHVKQTWANFIIPSLFVSFFVFTCFLSFSSSCSKTESYRLWQRSHLTPWSWTALASQAVFQPCGPVAVMSPFPFLFTGLGYCLTFLPTVTLLAQYFSKRRALVTSVASSGESFALFAFAPGECWVLWVEMYTFRIIVQINSM